MVMLGVLRGQGGRKGVQWVRMMRGKARGEGDEQWMRKCSYDDREQPSD